MRIFDTTTWAPVRTVTVSMMYSPFKWSPSSSELAQTVDPNSGTTDVLVVSATNPAADRTVPIAGAAHCHLDDWSKVTNRFALDCGGSVITASAVDGTDVRAVTPSCTAPPCTFYGNIQFSPSGGHLALGGATYSSFNPVTISDSKLVVAADVAGAVMTPVVVLPNGYQSFAINWR